jgi:hypothetical protein
MEEAAVRIGKSVTKLGRDIRQWSVWSALKVRPAGFAQQHAHAGTCTRAHMGAGAHAGQQLFLAAAVRQSLSLCSCVPASCVALTGHPGRLQAHHAPYHRPAQPRHAPAALAVAAGAARRTAAVPIAVYPLQAPLQAIDFVQAPPPRRCCAASPSPRRPPMTKPSCTAAPARPPGPHLHPLRPHLARLHAGLGSGAAAGPARGVRGGAIRERHQGESGLYVCLCPAGAVIAGAALGGRGRKALRLILAGKGGWLTCSMCRMVARAGAGH